MKEFTGVDGYEIKEDGKVFSISQNWRGYGVREMVQHPNSFGYMRVRLTVNGKRKSYFVHKLVASKYLVPKPSDKHQLRHLDGNKEHNHCDNLAWGTAKDNAADRDRHGRTSRGKSHGLAIKNGKLRRKALK